MKNTLPITAVTSIIMVVLGFSILNLTGCAKESVADETPIAPPSVKVFKVITRDLPDYYDYVGSTESILNVDIRARVKGYLEERLFEEGDDIAESQPLYVIEQRKYQADLDMAKARLSKNQAVAMDAKLEEDRHLDLFERNSVSASERDKYVAQSMAAQSQVALDEALVRNTDITFGYTSVASPIAGRISRTYVHVGNLVGAGEETLLTTVVKLDPIYLMFSPGAKLLPTVMRRMNENNPPQISARFSESKTFNHNGKIDFVNNAVDPTTSTILLRGVLSNPEKIILPGQFMHVRLWLDTMPNQMLIPADTVLQLQGGAVVLVADKKGKISYRRVEMGKTYGTHSQLQVVKKGLKPGDLVLTEKLLDLDAGDVISPQVMDPAKLLEGIDAGKPQESTASNPSNQLGALPTTARSLDM